MMAIHHPQKELFNYHVDLDQRIRPAHPLRRIKQTIDFSFVRAEVARHYGYNGHESVDPVVILKLMFLLFFDNVASERELMAVVAERLDYLWFLDFGLDDKVPDHSVLSKARARWGNEVFENLFVRTVAQCVAAGLVDGHKIHVDGSLVDANASKDSVVKSGPQLIAALKQVYAVTESKLEGSTTKESYEAINDRVVSTTDPDAAVVRKGCGESRPRYHHHRVVDDAQGVITAVESTAGSVAENLKLMDLVTQHQQNTGQEARTVVGDHKYGTADNYAACQQRQIVTHLGDARRNQHTAAGGERFCDSAFVYDAAAQTYRCPAGHAMRRRTQLHRGVWEYSLPRRICSGCPLRVRCTGARHGRTIQRHPQQPLVEQGRAQANSLAGKRNRRRRQHLMERSFADAANNHGFKRSRWRRLWRQQIQDYLIAAIQNIRILLSQEVCPPAAAMAEKVMEVDFVKAAAVSSGLPRLVLARVCRFQFTRRLWRVRHLPFYSPRARAVGSAAFAFAAV
jgi:transposase